MLSELQLMTPIKAEEEIAPKSPPKESTVKVSIERIPDPVSEPPVRRRPEVISKVYRVDNSLVRSGMALVGEKENTWARFHQSLQIIGLIWALRLM